MRFLFSFFNCLLGAGIRLLFRDIEVKSEKIPNELKVGLMKRNSNEREGLPFYNKS
jgi:hypothetical protein